MPKRVLWTAALVVLAGGGGWLAQHLRSQALPPVVDSRPLLRAVGPRLVSNQTEFAVALYGERLVPGLELHLGAPFHLRLPLKVLDAGHAYVRLPANLDLPPDTWQVDVPLSLDGSAASAASPSLTVVNDRGFVELQTLVRSGDGRWLYSASTTTDELFIIDTNDFSVRTVPTLDGPSALAVWTDPSHREWVVVGHLFAPQLLLLAVESPEREPRKVTAVANVSGLVVDGDRHIFYLAEHARDTVLALRWKDGQPSQLWRTEVAPNPKPMALTAEGLAVGSQQTGEVEVLEPIRGNRLARIGPGPQTAIIGGRTEAYGPYIMGGKAPRALAWSAKRKRLFVSNIGPNIGPNPDRMEVSMNGGVGVVDLAGSRWERHRGFGMGVTESLVLDDARGVLYSSDVALGRVRMLDAAALTSSDERKVQGALWEEIDIPPTEDFPLIRPEADFGQHGRATKALHSGPKAMVLSPDRNTLYVLNRFTGTLAVLEVEEPKKRLSIRGQFPIANTLQQRSRRLGQVLYFADLGQTAMSCDACHLEGHTEGVFFAKTHPLRIYRAPTVRGSRDTPPYFTPASTHSHAETAQRVGGRNRYQNPELTPAEVEALALFSSALTVLPNPFLEADGALARNLVLPDGATGNPQRGLSLFEGKAGCHTCHPAPVFTTDQDPDTRGKHQEVGTPRALMLRPQMQQLRFAGFPPPSLLGAWDIFPMFTSGAAGLEVRDDGSLGMSTRFPLRAAIEDYPQHGFAKLLSEQERNDLLAYVLSL